MYKTIKNGVDIAAAVEHYTGKSLVSCGSNTFELEDHSCPFCSSSDSFRVKTKEDGYGVASCFSQGLTGLSVIDFVSELKKIEPVDAIKVLSADFNIDLPTGRKPTEEEDILRIAAEYYHDNLLDNYEEPIEGLGKMSPLEYQNHVRKHSTETLVKMKVGYADGGLCDHLVSLGKSEEVIRKMRLANKSVKLRDMIPAGSFVYPHKHLGKVVKLTIKDPLKKNKFQPPLESCLIDYSLYNMDSVRNAAVVLIVEGENDVLAILDAREDPDDPQDKGWTGGAIATTGSISDKQLEWITANCKDRNVITMFDPDRAGNLYRKKLNNISSVFKSIVHCKMDDMDIDEFLKAGNTLKDAVDKYRVSVAFTGAAQQENLMAGLEASSEEATVESDEDVEGAGVGKIIEDKGCYWKIKYTPQGNEKLVPLTNFIMAVRNIYTMSLEKTREIIIRTQKGFTSEPVIIDSSDKVSLNSFRRIIANASDSSFYGSDADLTNIWEYVYQKSNPGKVFMPDTVGAVRKQRGWLFANVYVDMNGSVYEEDKSHICWVGGKTKGLKARSLASQDPNGDISEVPIMDLTLSNEQTQNMLGEFTRMLALNLGDTGMALTMLGWTWANAHSNEIFKMTRAFPFLWAWGGYGSGKTELMKMLLACYGMDQYGYTTVGALRSGVGFERKAAFYDSLPVLVDEMRADKMTQNYYPKFRGWYNRSPRSLGDKEADKVRIVPVRSNFIFCGQDVAIDPAVRERCITLNIPSYGREKEDSYAWMTSNSDRFSAIGLKWIIDAQQNGSEDAIDEIRDVMAMLAESCKSSRTRFQWGVAGAFGRRLGKMFFPKFKYDEYMIEATSKEAIDITEDDTLHKFFSSVEGLLAGDVPLLNNHSLMVKEGKLLIWFNKVAEIVSRFHRGEDFSDTSIKSNIQREPYFSKKPDRSILGQGVQRRVIAIDLKLAPEIITRIADSLTIHG